ncbi:MAG: 50S ribosomal protein L16 [Candidatus Omnitrophica bacterium]|nr:50S ribosomal protein L16 [Candidatus Omnitrophota bacterium]
MALMPKRVKYRKFHRGKRRGVATRGANLAFGEYGLKALGNAWLTNTQIEAIRVLLTRQLRRGGRLWLRVFPHKSTTKKPAETRMGKGKGELDKWVAIVKRGNIIFELGGIPAPLAIEACRLAAYKLPFRTKFVAREHK